MDGSKSLKIGGTMAINKKIVHSLTGSATRYIVMQGHMNAHNKLHIQIMAPNHPNKNRPYGFAFEAEINDEWTEIMYGLMKGV